MEGKSTAGGGLQQLLPHCFDNELQLTGRRARPSRSGGERIVEHAPVGIQELDAGARHVRVNPAFCRMLGYPAEELLGRSISDITASAEPAERIRDLLYAGSGIARFEVDYLRRDGSLLHGRVTAGVVPADGENAATVIAVVEDDAAETLVEDTAAVSDDPRIDAVEAVSAAVAQARETASQRGIDIAYAYAGQPVWVRADEAELRRALDELLSGAVESATLGSLAVRCAPSDGDALLEILEVRHPDAAGTDLAALFDDRLAGEAPDEPPPPPVSGELTTLLTLVQSHHGILGVSSSPDAGSRITVRLPLARG